MLTTTKIMFHREHTDGMRCSFFELVVFSCGAILGSVVTTEDVVLKSMASTGNGCPQTASHVALESVSFSAAPKTFPKTGLWP